MKKAWVLVLFFLLACQFLRTPDDFPPPPPTEPGTPPPMTVIVEWPQITATATLEPRPRPVLPSDMSEAEIFFLIIKTSLLAGDDIGIAERVKYPIRVTLAAQEVVLHDPDEFLAYYAKLFDQTFMDAFLELEETDLTLLPEGVRVGNGELWFNYFCIDLTCSESEFLVTQVNK